MVQQSYHLQLLNALELAGKEVENTKIVVWSRISSLSLC
jgi:hypothetical protein